jgi:protein TonB
MEVLMRTWSPRDRASAIATIALIVIAGCTIEVNINTNPDEKPSSPIVTVAPDAPAAPKAQIAPEAPTAPELEPTAGAEPAPPADAESELPAPSVRAPQPAPTPPTVDPDDLAVRDALFRFRQERTEPAPPPTDRDLSAEPTFTPFTQAPRIRNGAEVVSAIEDAYPPLLRDAGVGGTVGVYFFIDEEGTVRNTILRESSGHPALDEAALRVADVYRFEPALNRQDPVPVWVAFPITFQVR